MFFIHYWVLHEVVKRENLKNGILWTFICHNRTSDILGNSGHILHFFPGENSKLNFKNVKNNENYWKHKYDNIYV